MYFDYSHLLCMQRLYLNNAQRRQLGDGGELVLHSPITTANY